MWPFSSELKVNLYQIELIVMLGRVLVQFIQNLRKSNLLHKTVWAPFRRNMHEKRKNVKCSIDKCEKISKHVYV